MMATKGRVEGSPLTILWRIENIKLVLGKVGLEVRSPILRSHALGGKKFFLCFNPRFVLNNRYTRLALIQSEQFDFPIDCKWSFVNCKGSTLSSGGVRNQSPSENVRYVSNCSTHKLIVLAERSEYIPNDTFTVRCHIWKSEEYVPNNEFISCRTRLEELEHSFLWPVSRFSALELNEGVTTPVTFGDSRLKDNFLMKFLLKGASLEDSKANFELVPISVFQSCIVTLKLSVLNNRQNARIHAKSRPILFVEGNDTAMEFPLFMSRKEIMVDENDWLRNDVLTLCGEISTILFHTIIEKRNPDLQNLNLEISKDLATHADAICQTVEKNLEISNQEKISVDFLKEDFLNMYKEKKLTDFRIYSGDISFAVHKNILIARSPIFKAMFSSNMEESESGYLNIPDLDPPTLKRMLIFLYSGTLESGLELQSAVRLYYAADKYQIQSLKQHCSSILHSLFCVSNVSDFLALADQHQDKELTSSVHDFILLNFDGVMQSKEWEQFMVRDPALAGRTGLQLYRKKLQTSMSP